VANDENKGQAHLATKNIFQKNFLGKELSILGNFPPDQVGHTANHIFVFAARASQMSSSFGLAL